MSRARDLSRLVSDGADIIPFDRDIDYADGTIGAILRDQEGGNGYVVPSLASAIDAAPLIQATIDFAPAGSKIIIPRGTYSVLSTVSTDKDLHIDADGVTFNVNANVIPFRFECPPIAIRALTADYAPGDMSISVAALPVAPREGDVIKIVSNAVDPYNRDSGSSANQYRCGEMAVVGHGSTTTNIVLKSPLLFPRGIDPTSISGDEPWIDAYTTAMNARVLLLDRKSLSFTGATIQFEDGHEADWNSAGILVSGYRFASVDSVKIPRGYQSGIVDAGNFYMRVENCVISDLEDNTSLGQYGYGVVSSGGVGSSITGCTFSQVRHGVTTGASPFAADHTDWRRLLRCGATLAGRVSDCTGFGRDQAVFDTHHDARGWRFSNLTAIGGSSHVVALRGVGHSLDGLTARGSESGVRVFTELQSGDPDDDLYVAGKPQGQSTALLSNLDIRCKSLPIEAIAAREVVLGGINSFQTQDCRAISANGSHVIVAGDVTHRIAANEGETPPIDTAGASVFAAQPIPAALVATADYIPGVTFARGSSWRGNYSAAVDSTGALKAFNPSDATCLFDVQSLVHLTLSDDFSTLCAGGAASYRGDEGGLISWAVDGVADNAITTGLANKAVRAIARDGTAQWDAVGGPAREVLVYRNNGTVASHAGTGSENASVFNAPAAVAPSINEAGHYQRHEMVFRKSGSTGTATITGRMTGNFNWSRVMAASDLVLCVTMEVWTRGPNSQFVRVTSSTNDANNDITAHKQSTVVRTFDLTTGQINRIGINAAVGDTITLETYAIYADKGGFGV